MHGTMADVLDTGSAYRSVDLGWDIPSWIFHGLSLRHSAKLCVIHEGEWAGMFRVWSRGQAQGRRSCVCFGHGELVGVGRGRGSPTYAL